MYSFIVHFPVDRSVVKGLSWHITKIHKRYMYVCILLYIYIYIFYIVSMPLRKEDLFLRLLTYRWAKYAA